MALGSICGKFDELVSGRQTKLQDSWEVLCMSSIAGEQSEGMTLWVRRCKWTGKRSGISMVSYVWYTIIFHHFPATIHFGSMKRRPCSLAPGIGRKGNLSDVSSAGAPWDRSSWCMLSLGWIQVRCCFDEGTEAGDQSGAQVFAELPGKCTRASGNVVPAKCQFSFAYDVKAEFFRGQFSVVTDLWICLANLQTNTAHIDLKYIKIH